MHQSGKRESHELLRQLGRHWTLQPPVVTVSEIGKIDSLISRTSSQGIRRRLEIISRDYPEYRSIRGDGNCFYRSIAFLYLRKHPRLCEFQRVFPLLGDIDMHMCRNCPEEFRTIYNDKDLKSELARGWMVLFDEMTFCTQYEKESYLMHLLNSSWLLDMLIVLYLRCCNYKYIQENRSKMTEFTDNDDDATTVSRTLTNIMTYGEDSQGLELQTISLCLDEDFKIIYVREDTTAEYALRPERINTNMKVLLLTPGHYDILYSAADSTQMRDEYHQRLRQLSAQRESMPFVQRSRGNEYFRTDISPNGSGDRNESSRHTYSGNFQQARKTLEPFAISLKRVAEQSKTTTSAQQFSSQAYPGVQYPSRVTGMIRSPQQQQTRQSPSTIAQTRQSNQITFATQIKQDIPEPIRQPSSRKKSVVSDIPTMANGNRGIASDDFRRSRQESHDITMEQEKRLPSKHYLAPIVSALTFGACVVFIVLFINRTQRPQWGL